MLLNPKHIQLGEKGEKLARMFLLNQDYLIIERNYSFRHLEVDIIAEKNDEIVFVEVKTRSNYYEGGPEHAVDKEKQHNLIQIAEQFMMKHELENAFRIDIISVVLKDSIVDIQHFENAGAYWDFMQD